MKIGRNDPCPCGSGKKYKKCCGAEKADETIIEASKRFGVNSGFVFKPSKAPTFMESLGAPNKATALMRQIESVAAGKPFGSLEDLQAFMDDELRRRNEGSVDAFLGLSPEDMFLIHHDTQTAIERLLEFREPIDEAVAAQIPLLRQSLYLLRALRDNPLTLTATGSLKPAFVGQWFDAAFAFGETPEIKAILRPRREGDCFDIYRVRTICRRTGLIKTIHSEMSITRKGIDMTEGPNFTELYRTLFAGTLDVYADDTLDLNESMPWLAGHSVLFALYLLGKKARKDLTYTAVLDLLREAFPDAPELADEYAIIHSVRFGCEYPAILLGLAEEKPIITGLLYENRTIRTGLLYDRLLHWKK